MQSREVDLIKRPEGLPTTDDFRVVETQVGEPADGEVLVQNLYMSVDPAMRPQMSRGYELGKPMMGGAIGRIVASRHAELKEGDMVPNRMAFGSASCRAAAVSASSFPIPS